MAVFKPFKGLLPRVKDAEQIVSRPFDAYSKQELSFELSAHPDSFLHVISPLSPDVHIEINYHDKLELGKSKLFEMIKSKVFEISAHPCYYIYRQTQHHEQYIGIIGAISIDDCLTNIVKPHEQTIEHKEVRLKNYLDYMDINAEPVVISYKADHLINELVEKKISDKPHLDFYFKGFGQHELWKVEKKEDIQIIESQFGGLNEMYIADGHHRTASSVLLGKERREKYPDYSGEEPFNYFMAIAFPHHQIRLREFNRLVHDINGLSIDEFIHRIKKDFFVEKLNSFPDISGHIACFAMYLEHHWYILQMKPEVFLKVDEQNALPTQILSDFILSPILEIHDLRKDKRISFAGGKTEPDHLKKIVDSDEYKVAFVVNKINIPQFKKFADNGWFMPPKSTYFEPKLLNGLVLYSLDDNITNL